MAPDFQILSIRLPGTDNRIVVYFTSLRGVRRTYEDCYAVVDELSESYTCVITHFGNNLTSKRVYFGDELSGVVDDPNAVVVEAFSDVVFYKSVFPCNSGGRVWTRSIKLLISSSPLPYDGGKGEQKHRQVQFYGSAQQVALTKQRADKYIYSQLVQQPGAQQPVLQ
ncbi:hypothetical protein PS2_003347 [Malus domestica]